ncbi:MnhB domain-containing protein [Kribbella sp. NPDC059898]|uniref:MnhB domain-containing protein n=1 Tax=Kribbella sp. NPDC059898 TaxID=3346995 RepID=UPI0036655933
MHRPVVGWLLGVATAVVLGLALVGLLREGVPLPPIARQAMTVALPQWRTTEPVSEVVYGTRAFDTFGETFLLLAAVVSVLLLARRRDFFGEEEAGLEEQQYENAGNEPIGPAECQARAADDREEREPGPETPDAGPIGSPASERAVAMTAVVRVAVRTVLPLLAVAGFYLVLQGYSPGGGFPAGVVLVGLVLLIYAGFGYRRIARIVRPGPLEVLELAGALLVVVVLALGLILEGSFGANWLPLAPERTLRSGGTLRAFSLAELIEVGTGLTIVVFSILAIRHDWTPANPDDAGEDDR